MKRNVLILLALFVLAGIAVYQNFANAKKEQLYTNEAIPKVGFMAPALSIKAMDGHSYSIGGKRDKPMLINFWASWCGPCEDEAPDLKKLQDQYGDRFDLYAINKTNDDDVEGAQAFVKLYQFDFPILMDADGKASKQYGVDGIPMSFLVDKKGVIQDVVFGGINLRKMGKQIEKLAEQDVD